MKDTNINKESNLTSLQPDKATSKPPTQNRQFDSQLIEKLKKIIAKYTDQPDKLNGIEKMSDDTDINFIKELNIDSVDVVEIVVDIEEEFSIVIEDSELLSFRSFGDMYNLIEVKLGL